MNTFLPSSWALPGKIITAFILLGNSTNCLASPLFLDSSVSATSVISLLFVATTSGLLFYGLNRHYRHQLSLKKLKRSEEQLRWALWGSGDGLWDWNISTGEVNRRGIPQLLGYNEDEFENTSAQLIKLMHPDDTAAVYSEIERHLSGKSSHFEAEYRVLSKDGNWRWILDKGKVVARDENGKPLRAAGTQTDITQRKRAEEELRLAAEVIQSMNEVVVITDSELRIQLVNHAFIRLMGKSENEVIGKPIQHFFSYRHDRSFYKQILEQLDNEHYWQGELWQKTARGQDILTRMELKRVEQFKKDSEYFVAIFSDITEKKRAEDKLIYLANYDTLTGLPNRALFHQRLTQTINQSKTSGEGFSLVCVDVDHFKQINDSLGHAIGDQLLQRIAINLKQYVPVNNATVARLAGDEFIVLLPEQTEKASLMSMAQMLLTHFLNPITIEHHEITISPSIGICRYPVDGTDTLTLMRNVENALHFAKSKGRNNYQFYNEDIQTKNLRKLTVGNHLRRALDKQELELVYQPKLDLKNNRLTGMEALLRWHSADIGAIEPNEFISIAEETGLVNEIGSWVLKEACFQAYQWHKQNFDLPVSVNISAKQFQQRTLYRIIANVLAETQLPPQLLELEITETMLMEDPDSAIATLAQLKIMGVRISIDDFGTGYSSLSYLKKLPIDTLKIDKTFIQDITHDRDDKAITTAIIGLANNLHLDVVAEGVETQEQLELLKAARCPQVQGYLIAPPMTAEEAFGFMQIRHQSTPPLKKKPELDPASYLT